MLTACKHDILFWLSAFCWLYEPRPKIVDGVQIPKRLPFVPWEHQEQPIRQLREHLGFLDIGIEKSRGEGFSWIVIYLALHDWLFDEGANVGLVSRTEDEADDPENSDSLFWKIDWALARLPKWMAGVKGTDWSRNLSKHSLTNFRNGSQINADAATGSVFRGGRKKWALFDEFGFFKKGEDKQALASSQGATNSRLFVSTVNGSDNEYHRVMHEPSNMLRIIVDWKDNPTKTGGCTSSKKASPLPSMRLEIRCRMTTRISPTASGIYIPGSVSRGSSSKASCARRGTTTSATGRDRRRSLSPRSSTAITAVRCGSCLTMTSLPRPRRVSSRRSCREISRTTPRRWSRSSIARQTARCSCGASSITTGVRQRGRMRLAAT
jgi:hypothetical protein